MENTDVYVLNLNILIFIDVSLLLNMLLNMHKHKNRCINQKVGSNINNFNCTLETANFRIVKTYLQPRLRKM
jgi:hypothetical protein